MQVENSEKATLAEAVLITCGVCTSVGFFLGAFAIYQRVDLPIGTYLAAASAMFGVMCALLTAILGKLTVRKPDR